MLWGQGGSDTAWTTRRQWRDSSRKHQHMLTSCQAGEWHHLKDFWLYFVLTGGRKWCWWESGRKPQLKYDGGAQQSVIKHKSLGWRYGNESWVPVVSETTEITVKLIVLQTWLLLQLTSGQEMRKYIETTARVQLPFLSLFFTCLLLGSMLTAEFMFQFCLHSQN